METRAYSLFKNYSSETFGGSQLKSFTQKNSYESKINKRKNNKRN